MRTSLVRTSRRLRTSREDLSSEDLRGRRLCLARRLAGFQLFRGMVWMHLCSSFYIHTYLYGGGGFNHRLSATSTDGHLLGARPAMVGGAVDHNRLPWTHGALAGPQGCHCSLSCLCTAAFKGHDGRHYYACMCMHVCAPPRNAQGARYTRVS